MVADRACASADAKVQKKRNSHIHRLFDVLTGFGYPDARIQSDGRIGLARVEVNANEN
jgi:hypothetical protein